MSCLPLTWAGSTHPGSFCVGSRGDGDSDEEGSSPSAQEANPPAPTHSGLSVVSSVLRQETLGVSAVLTAPRHTHQAPFLAGQ